MNLVKWLRKNNRKLMAVVVVIIMLGFVGGTYLQQLTKRRMGLNKNEVVATFADNKEITQNDIEQADLELKILRMLKADTLLRSVQVPMFRTPDMQPLMLGELLFTDRQTSPMVISRIKQVARTNGYLISDKQINALYKGTLPAKIYWLLLKNEAQQAGIMAANEQAGQLLGSLIPQFFDGATYQQIMTSMINQGIPEPQVLQTMAKLLAVLEYAKLSCSSEDFTQAQIKHDISIETETLNLEFVRFDSALFTETQPNPTEEQILSHFEKYKAATSGNFNQENPHGFGYKLPPMIQLDYIVVKLDDVAKIIPEPTQQEMETFYQKNRERMFIEQILSDPNDPNSRQMTRIKSYAEVADEVAKNLMTQKIRSKSERILKEAVTIIDTAFEDIDITTLTTDQLAEKAGDYQTAAQQVSEKYKINLYAGQTGLLAADDMRADEYLSRLFIGAGMSNAMELTTFLFSVDPLNLSELGPFGTPKPKIYQNISPIMDMFSRVMVMVRIVKTNESSVPESVETTIAKNGIVLDETTPVKAEKIYFREKVTEDLKKTSAMNTAKTKAEEFIVQIVKDGWEDAITNFNQLYKKPISNPDDPNAFKLNTLTGIQRIPTEKIETLTVQNEGDPTAQLQMNMTKKDKLLIEKFYALIPDDANSLVEVPKIVEFAPDLSCYCLKSLSLKRLDKADYEKVKVIYAYRKDIIQSQSLAAAHFNPENILKRMNFALTKEKQSTENEVIKETKGKP